MTTTDQSNRIEPPAGGRRPRLATALASAAALLALTLVCGGCWPKPAAVTTEPPKAEGLPAYFFHNWPTPDLALVLSGQMHGYLSPCGCSRPQIGGLERRYNFIQMLKAKGWPLVLADVGDLPQRQGPVDLPNVQALIKYRYTMKALKAMNYTAVGIGEYETTTPSLFHTLGEWALNDLHPRVVSANLLDVATKFPTGPDDKPVVAEWEQTKAAGVAVGIAGLVGQSVRDAIKDPDAKFGPSVPSLERVLSQMDKANIDLRVLLYQGSQTRGIKGKAAEAVELSKAFPQFQLVVCLSEEDEPSANPVVVKHPDGRETMAVALGHKGKHVGVVGVYKPSKAGAPFELRYQLAEMSEAFLTSDADEPQHPIHKLMDDYTRELKDNNYLARYDQKRHPLQFAAPPPAPTFVGTDKCQGCHKSAFKIWQKTKHSEAYQTLVDAKHTSNRQFDPECIVCHTVGFGYQTGFRDATTTAHLENVGCESCHGPASRHVEAETAANNRPQEEKDQWRKLLNPWRAPDDETEKAKNRRLDAVEAMCTKCHDTDNDVDWKFRAFGRKWEKIAHPNE